MKSLENKVAIVTGGGSGIGKAIAILYAAEGAKIIVSDINEQAGNETVSAIKAKGGNAIFVKADTSKPDDHKNVVEQAVKQFGGLHIAVNNAGIGGPLKPTGEYPIDGWDKVISINLSGVFYGMRYQIPAMLNAGGGSIVNVASILGKVGTPNSPAYVAAKHGVVGLTEAAALEYASQKIRTPDRAPSVSSDSSLSLGPRRMVRDGSHARAAWTVVRHSQRRRRAVVTALAPDSLFRSSHLACCDSPSNP